MRTATTTLLAWLALAVLPLAAASADTKVEETYLCPYIENGRGGFSPWWCTYIQSEPKPGAEPDEKGHYKWEDQNYYVLVNGHKLGPYELVSSYVAVSPNLENTAFAAKQDGKWVIVVNGQPRWTHDNLGIIEASWSGGLRGDTLTMQTRCVDLCFAQDGSRLAYRARNGDEPMRVFVNGAACPDPPLHWDQLILVGGEPLFATVGDDKCYFVHGNNKLGPYTGSWCRPSVSDDGAHYAVAAKRDEQSVLVVDGKEVAVPGELVTWEVGATGTWACVSKGLEGQTLLFGPDRRFGPYEEITRPTISPDGRHVAFWARTGAERTVVTDTRTYPGFGGDWVVDIGGRQYRIMWSLDATHLAYFTRPNGQLVLDGVPVPKEQQGEIPGFMLVRYVDENGQQVGGQYMGGPLAPPATIVAALLAGGKVPPLKCDMLRDTLTYTVEEDNQHYAVIGTRREGPYTKVLCPPAGPQTGSHYVYLVEQGGKSRVVVDGQLVGKPYDVLVRGTVRGTEFFCLGVRDGGVYRVTCGLGD